MILLSTNPNHVRIGHSRHTYLSPIDYIWDLKRLYIFICKFSYLTFLLSNVICLIFFFEVNVICLNDIHKYSYKSPHNILIETF